VGDTSLKDITSSKPPRRAEATCSLVTGPVSRLDVELPRPSSKTASRVRLDRFGTATSTGRPARTRSTNRPVTADVSMPRVSRDFNAFTLQDVQLHGWSERATVDENLGGGITGQFFLTTSSQYGDWSVRTVWPVLGTEGNRPPRVRTRGALRPGRPAGHRARPQDRCQSTAALSLDERLTVDRDFLTVFASEIIKGAKAATTRPSKARQPHEQYKQGAQPSKPAEWLAVRTKSARDLEVLVQRRPRSR